MKPLGPFDPLPDRSESNAKALAEYRARADAESDAAKIARRAAEDERRADARAAGERQGLALAELHRRAAAGDEEAAAILKARAEAEVAQKAARADEAHRLKEAVEMAAREQHADVPTAELAPVVLPAGVEWTYVGSAVFLDGDGSPNVRGSEAGDIKAPTP
jgi:hypothetical protein